MQSAVDLLLRSFGLVLLNIGVSMNYGPTEDAHFHVFYSVTTTRGRIQSQYLPLRQIKTVTQGFFS